MKRSLHTLTLIILASLVLSACNMPSTGQSVPTSPPLPTQTQPPMVTVTQPGGVSTAVPTQLPPSPTVAPPTATNTPLPTDTPTATPTTLPGACTDKIKFVDDITIPDNTELLPGQDFVKTWRLQNAGTCTWTSQYSLVFVSGDQMSAVSPLPITGSTAPGATLDVSASMKSPGTVGSYQGNWELQNPAGVKFGTGNNASEPFYVLIKVVEGVSELNLGNPTWTDNMDNAAASWYLLSTANTKFTQGDGKLVMTQSTPDQGDEWGVSNKASMKDYYLQATFITGGTCSGLDKYGLLARAPIPARAMSSNSPAMGATACTPGPITPTLPSRSGKLPLP